MRKRLVIRFIIAAAILGIIVIPSSSLADRESGAITQGVGYTFQNPQRTSNELSTQGRFVLALLAARVPGGSVWIRQCTGQEPVFHQDQTILPLNDALDSITRVDPRYRWQMDSGVANLIPRTGEPSLLKLRIKRFETKASLNVALRQLLALPEVKSQASSLGLKASSGGLLVGPSPFHDGPSQIDLNIKDITLREALNALVRANGRAIWEYREYRCVGVNEFSVDFVAQ